MKGPISFKKLVRGAEQVKKRAYAPYSKYKVGAALLAGSGKIYSGCNIENASYPASLCAERVAISKAVSEGEKSFQALALVSNRASKPMPCGLCRQVLWELAGDIEIIIRHGASTENIRLSKLFPKPFQMK